MLRLRWLPQPRTVRTDLRLIGRGALWGARFILTAISASLYAVAFAVGFVVRVLIVARAWTAAALLLGYEDAMPHRDKPVDDITVMPAGPNAWAPTPNVLRRELRRRMKKVG